MVMQMGSLQENWLRLLSELFVEDTDHKSKPRRTHVTLSMMLFFSHRMGEFLVMLFAFSHVTDEHTIMKKLGLLPLIPVLVWRPPFSPFCTNTVLLVLYCSWNSLFPFFPVQSERTESGMLTRSGSVRLPEGKKIAFNLSKDNVFQNKVSASICKVYLTVTIKGYSNEYTFP